MEKIGQIIAKSPLNNPPYRVIKLNKKLINPPDGGRGLGERVAQWLADTLNDQAGIKFYRKVAKKLANPRIYELLTFAREKGNNPKKLFTALAYREYT